MDFVTLLIVLAGGFFAGVINTLAGNGSAITLTILTEVLGLPGTLANGTNRIGIAAQSLTSGYAFHRHGHLSVRDKWVFLLPVILGAILGIYVATQVDNAQFRTVFRYLMVLMLIVVLVKPGRWLRETDAENRPSLWIMTPLTFILGFYGGFIQMGMGVFFLAVMVLVGRFSLLDANAMKIFVIAIYTIIAL
ncbi:MAG: sulfite exporter TauE/SafE family protein, partial [Phaeodactylibacter sp.]|nr:sulfite exporter TauE/SafE family protein [Phaeodactylibacter sp.]